MVIPKRIVLGFLFAENVEKTTPLRSVGSSQMMPDAAITVESPMQLTLKVALNTRKYHLKTNEHTDPMNSNGASSKTNEILAFIELHDIQ